MPRGDYLGIVGPNGSGKSTLIKSILGILQPGRGCIYLFGESLASFNQWRKIGYLPQRLNALNVYFPGTVEEIVRLGVATDKNSLSIKQILGQMGIEHLSSRLIGELSYGEQQRTMLARALAGRPELLILDEPTNHINFRHIPVIAKAIDDFDGAMILVSHSQDFVEKIRVDFSLDLGALR